MWRKIRLKIKSCYFIHEYRGWNEIIREWLSNGLNFGGSNKEWNFIRLRACWISKEVCEKLCIFNTTECGRFFCSFSSVNARAVVELRVTWCLALSLSLSFPPSSSALLHQLGVSFLRAMAPNVASENFTILALLVLPRCSIAYNRSSDYRWIRFQVCGFKKKKKIEIVLFQ